MKNIMTKMSQENSLLNKVFEGKEKFDCRIYVHGSYSDGTNCEFSDIDDLIIKEGHITKEFENWLNEVHLRMLHIDPLQHHGHFIIDSEDLEYYDESNLPMHIMDNCITMKGCYYIFYKNDPLSTKINLQLKILETLRYSEFLFRRFKKRELNVYHMKKLMGCIFLLPAMAYQHNGIEMNKRDAIKYSIKGFLKSEYSKNILIKMSTLREDWGDLVTNKENFLQMKEELEDKNLLDFIDHVKHYSPKFEFDTNYISNLEFDSFKTDILKCI